MSTLYHPLVRLALLFWVGEEPVAAPSVDLDDGLFCVSYGGS